MNSDIDKVTTKNRFYQFIGLSFLFSFIIVGFSIISIKFFNSDMNNTIGETGKPDASKYSQYIQLE